MWLDDGMNETATTSKKATVKQWGGRLLRLYVHEHGISRGSQPRGELQEVLIIQTDGSNDFYVNGRRIDRLGVAMKVWGQD